MRPDRIRHPVALGTILTLLTVGIAVALATSEPSGTGAVNVGAGDEEPAGEPSAPVADEPQPRRPDRERRCRPTRSNPGGDNNYLPDAPELDSLGSGFVITGRVRAASGCGPLKGVRVQVWLATETGSEQDNRTTVRTDEDGRYRIRTAPTVPQFGEPNIHVAYDAGTYRPVFIRRVVDLDDPRAVVDLTLARVRG